MKKKKDLFITNRSSKFHWLINYIMYIYKAFFSFWDGIFYPLNALQIDIYRVINLKNSQSGLYIVICIPRSYFFLKKMRGYIHHGRSPGEYLNWKIVFHLLIYKAFFSFWDGIFFYTYIPILFFFWIKKERAFR